MTNEASKIRSCCITTAREEGEVTTPWFWLFSFDADICIHKQYCGCHGDVTTKIAQQPQKFSIFLQNDMYKHRVQVC